MKRKGIGKKLEKEISEERNARGEENDQGKFKESKRRKWVKKRKKM